MLIAKELRKTNIAEYILYMWQVEDLLRVCSFNPENINQQLVARFNADENASKEIAAWYNNLAVAMANEHIQEKGHLQAIINLVNDLTEFHLKMLEVQKDQEYVRLYQSNQDAISEIFQRSGMEYKNEVEVCLNALYGFLLLKLKNVEMTELTAKSIEGFGKMIGHLSARYIQFENDDFEF
jgi:hypothetical protein